MLNFQSNATRISFRDAGYIFRINELIRHHALYIQDKQQEQSDDMSIRVYRVFLCVLMFY